MAWANANHLLHLLPFLMRAFDTHIARHFCRSAVQKTIDAVSPSVELAKKKYIEAHDMVVVSLLAVKL